MSSEQQSPFTFYDVTSRLWPTPWSPYTIRTQLTLQSLSLPHTHTPISYPHIASLLSSLSVPIPPSLKDKSIQYTLPALQHGEHTIMGSTEIALYLSSLSQGWREVLFPGDAEREVERLEEVWKVVLGEKGMWRHVIPFVPAILDDEGKQYFIRTREERFGSLEKLREDVLAEEAANGGLKAKVQEVVIPLLELLDELDSSASTFTSAANGVEAKGVFVAGRDKPSYPDFIIVAMVKWWIAARGETEIMEALESVGGGRIARIVKGCEFLQARDLGKEGA